MSFLKIKAVRVIYREKSSKKIIEELILKSEEWEIIKNNPQRKEIEVVAEPILDL
jgi:hypothetical protein